MDKNHAMTIRKFIATGLLILFTTVMLALTPVGLEVAEAITFDGSIITGDEAQGDVTEDQCANLDENLAGAMGCDTDDRIIDFTEYTGEFEGPDASGYDDALTQSSSAREFIQTVVNFALSFLGLVATIVIIYGGIMYVLSRGDEEMASKGKKTISYAAIGIVIVLASFALVNTLISAGGGGGADSSLGGGATGTTISETGASFNVDSVLDELEYVSTEYVQAYSTYLEVSEEVAYLLNIEMPLVVDITDTDYSLGGVFEYVGGIFSGTDTADSYEDIYTLIDEDDVDAYIDDMREGLQRIQSEVDSLSDTYESAQDLYNYLRSGTTSSLMDTLFACMLPTANAEGSKADPCASRDYSEGTFRELGGVGLSVQDTDVDLIDDNICDALTDVQTAADSDYEEAVAALIEQVQDMDALFDTDEYSTGSKLTQVKNALSNLEKELTSAKTSITANTARNVLDRVNDLYSLVQNLEFVKVILTASTIDGNAPLIVNFDVLGTEDPSGETVQDTQITWDLDGNGYFDDGEGSAVTYTYDETGTYRVRVRVVSNEADVAAGVSEVTIIVEPPRSVIMLTAEAGGETTVLADFSTFPVEDKDTYKVTLAEAQDGITFDASTTTDGDKNVDGIVSYEWDFGDNDFVSGNRETAGAPLHYYGEQGTYNVSLAVTDATGVEDRKYFKLYVASPAARLIVTPGSGAVGDSFKFDASGSSTDVGSIVSYQWSATAPDASDHALNTTSGSVINESFDMPGIYTMTLTIGDSSGNTDTTYKEFLVESQAPVATFNYEITNSNKPATVAFDATDSYDPDNGDTITYEWDFDGTEGEDYTMVASDGEGSEVTVQFLQPEDYDVQVTVTDQHEDELQKSASFTKIISITSVLDVDLEVDGDTARHLDDNGEASVEFTAYSEVATGFEIDYGDDETDFTESITRGQATFTHTYEDAGVFYATLTAYDADSKTNSMTRRIYVASGNSPIAVIDIDANGEDLGFGSTLSGNVNTKFTFDASNSVNVDGSISNLSYSWNFGDGTTSSQKTVTHSYDEHATFIVALTVRDKDNTAISDDTTMSIQIEGLDPEIRGVSVTPQGTSLETPVKVNLTVDAVDEDGKITYVKGWYYDLEDSATELGTVIAQTTSFTLTVNTKGEEGDVHEYAFAVEVTDDDNNTVSIFEEMSTDSIPTLEVTNGPNDSPVANFSVDRSSVFVGEEVIFSSTSYDPDGSIASYWWDIEGDGFYNNEETTTDSLTHTFTQVYPDGVEVQLKVEDDTGATATSDIVKIYVDAIADAPEAAFLADINGTEVTFRNNSTIDEENGAALQGLYWDFDLATDSDGNGTPDDDFDSFEENPVYNYDEFGTYQVQLVIVDSLGQTDSVSQDITVQESDEPAADFSYTVEGKTVKFTNLSVVDEANDAEVRSYSWDFDDTDSIEINTSSKNPSFEYESYETYTVTLIVEDSYGKTDTITQDVELLDPMRAAMALLTSVPTANSLGQIIASGDDEVVTFYFSADGGSDDYTFTFDKNIFYDTDGDGIRDNDIDYSTVSPGTWETTFYESYGQIVVKLSVTDNETGDTDVTTLQVVFEGSLGSANLFNVTPATMLAFIIFALFTAALGVTLSFNYNPISKH